MSSPGVIQVLRLLTLTVAATVLLSGCGSGSGASRQADSSSAPSPSAVAAAPRSSETGLQLVALGDSIPMNSPDDCPGCTGFVDRYATALGQATGKHVSVTNLSQHTGLTLPQLLQELDGFRAQVTTADAVIVGIAHNSNELNAERPCGKPGKNDQPDWSAVDAQCAITAARRFRPQFEQLYSTIAGWRQGKPTMLRTINRYNDWIGFADAHLTPAAEHKTALVIAQWNKVLCAAATAHGFLCADVSRAFNGPSGLRPSGDLLAGDYTHPSDTGNALIARTLIGEGFAPLKP